MESIRRHFDFNPEDIGMIEALVRFLIERDGRAAHGIDAVRFALRKAVKGLPK